jgi:hypothetical protein
MSARGGRGAAFALSLALSGCGSNRPTLPSGISAAESCSASAYPDAPYGAEPGSVMQNACFRGWTRPDRSAHDEASLEPVQLADYFDPTGASGSRLLLINTAAVWCSACRVEHEHLPERAQAFTSRGLVILSALFQDQERNPAEVSELSAWVESFATNFPMVLDPTYQFGLYASAETAPLNLVVDARSMTILQKYIGDQSAVMWPYIESQLDR